MIIFVASLSLLTSIGMELMPSSDEGEFSVTVKAPKGSKLEVVDDLSLQVEEMLEEIPELVSMVCFSFRFIGFNWRFKRGKYNKLYSCR